MNIVTNKRNTAIKGSKGKHVVSHKKDPNPTMRCLIFSQRRKGYCL